MPEIWFANITVKTKTGSLEEKIICKKMDDKEMQGDEQVAKKLLRLEKRGMDLEKQKLNGFPLIQKISWIKYLSDTN